MPEPTVYHAIALRATAGGNLMERSDRFGMSGVPFAWESDMQERRYYVYIMTNKWNRVLYIGVTNDLVRRVFEHQEGLVMGFTRKYKVGKLVYFEEFVDPKNAIQREKQLKSGSREKKVALIIQTNPKWRDLFTEIASQGFSSR